MAKQEKEGDTPASLRGLTKIDLSQITEKVSVPPIEEKKPGTRIDEKLRIWLMILLSVLIGVVALIIGGAVIYYIRHLSDWQNNLNGISKLLQLTVTSILVPLITLFLGYIFGRNIE